MKELGSCKVWVAVLLLLLPAGGLAQLAWGPRVGVQTSAPWGEVSLPSVRGAHLYDYTFATAPTDWKPGGGTWELTNRFQCDPRWSFYGGTRRKGVAVTWNKRRFLGDIAVEAYVAFKHGLPWNIPWTYRPSDLNLTLCGDGRNFSSGYHFIFSGENGQRTLILRGERVLAATEDPRFLTPSFADSLPMEHLHRRWWRLEARRQGHRLSFFVDGELALQAEDPDPLPGGQVGLWTTQNGIMVARVRIAYAQEEPASLPSPSPSPPPLPSPAVPSLVVASPTHPGLMDDFEAHLGGWQAGPGEDPVELVRDATTAASGQCSLRITNRTPGGEFGAEAVPRFDVSQMGYLSFDYRVTPDVKVNLYLKARGQDYEIGFTGPAHGADRAIFLGQIAGVVADGQWHHAEFDLRAHLARWDSTARRFLARHLFFGNQHDEYYLQSGFGGNYAGTHYFLDNFQLRGVGGDTVRLQWEPYRTSEKGSPSLPFRGFSYLWDALPNTLPDEVAEGSVPEVTYQGAPDGLWFFHVRAQAADGRWGPATHFPFRVDSRPPTVGRPSPPPGARACPLRIVLPVRDEGAGVDPASLRLEVSGRLYTLENQALTYDPVAGEVQFDPAAAGLQWTDGESVTVRLVAAQDRLQHGLEAPFDWSWTMDYAQDTTPPQAPRLWIGAEALGDGTFEYGLDEWETYGGLSGAHLERTTETAAAGRYSLKLTCLQNGGAFTATIRKTPFDAAKYRIVSFDYKVPPRLRVDFLVNVGNISKTIRFTDTDAHEGSQIGTVPNVIADGQWHHAEFNLYELLRRALPKASTYQVTRFLLTGVGNPPMAPNHPGNYAGTSYYLDNFHLVPVAGAADALHWAARDPTGVAGATIAFSPRPFPATVGPDAGQYVAGTSQPLAGLSGGMGYFAAWLQDAAGHRSEPVFTRAWIDLEAPRCGTPLPAPGTQAAPSQILIPLDDGKGSGVDPASLVLAVQGIDYTVARNPQQSTGLRYDPEAHRVIWDCRTAAAEPIVFPDGVDVTYRLKQARDFAGNPLPDQPAWTFTMAYAEDHRGPEVAVGSPSHPGLAQDTFETDLGNWYSPDGSARLTLDPTTAAHGNSSMKITNARLGGPFDARWDHRPIPMGPPLVVSFDYKLPADLRVDLLVCFQLAPDPFGGWRALGLTDLDSRLPKLGRLPDIQADGHWHHLEFNLSDYLKGDPRLSKSTVVAFGFGDRGRYNNPRGAFFHLDNFILTRPGRGKVRLSWSAADETGIAGYSFVLDTHPDTLPPEAPLRPETEITYPGLPAARSYFHIRACDGAGNWGPTTHWLLCEK